MLVVRIVFMGFLGESGQCTGRSGGGASGLSGTVGLLEDGMGTEGGLRTDLGFSGGAGGCSSTGRSELRLAPANFLDDSALVVCGGAAGGSKTGGFCTLSGVNGLSASTVRGGCANDADFSRRLGTDGLLGPASGSLGTSAPTNGFRGSSWFATETGFFSDGPLDWAVDLTGDGGPLSKAETGLVMLSGGL